MATPDWMPAVMSRRRRAASTSKPKPPAPMVDSRDKGLRDAGAAAMGLAGGYSGSTRDPRSTDALDFDGTSQSVVKGFESVWNFELNADGSRKTEVPEPFSIKEG